MLRKMQYLVVILSFCLSANAAVWYVDKDNASGTEDGKSWETAFTTIQPAIDAAYEDSPGQVWVAEGTYDEQRVSMLEVSPEIYPGVLDDTGSLLMREEVHIFGGFTGNETVRAQRDWDAHPSTIDASVARNGEAGYHTVVGADNATLDGFVITGGNANGEHGSSSAIGWGFLNLETSPTMRNCTFVGNSTGSNNGGEVVNLRCGPIISGCVFVNTVGWAVNEGSSWSTITHCRFANNAWAYGGAIQIHESRTTIDHCEFSDNNISHFGAMILSSGGNVKVRNCTFTDNHFDRESRAISNYGGTASVERCVFQGNSAAVPLVLASSYFASERRKTSVTNCVFSGNVATSVVSAIDVGDWAGGLGLSLDVTNCTFADNTASPVLSIDEADADIINCIFWNNASEEISSHTYYTSTVVTSCDIQGGWPGYSILDSAPMFVDPENGDFRLQPGSPCIDAGTLEDAPETDINGINRPLGDGVDMGAYEYIDFDINGDGVIDAADIQLVINTALGYDVSPMSGDVNGDGRVDAVDVQLTTNAALGV